MTEEDAKTVQSIRDLVAAGDLSEAARACEDGLRRTAEGPAACIFQALLSTTAGHLDEAVAQYEGALALAPDALPAYMGIADILTRKEWFSSAVIVMENARTSTAFTVEAQQQLDALQQRVAERARALRESTA